MRANEGDRIVVHGNKVGQPDRAGVVKEVRHGDGEPMYRVAWDDGTESMFMPSSGVAVVIEEGAA
jgi:hypothetical protein